MKALTVQKVSVIKTIKTLRKMTDIPRLVSYFVLLLKVMNDFSVDLHVYIFF